MVARFAREHRVPYIIVPAREYADFVNNPSALSDLLRERYRPLQDTPWGKVLERVPDGPSAP